MASNYFNVPTYNAPRTVNPYAVTRTPLPIPGQAQFDAVGNAGAFSDQPGYAQRTQILGQIGTGPGSVGARYDALMQARQKNAAAQLRGFGGVSFAEDDPSTPDVNESLNTQYESGRLGQNERAAYKSATAAGAAKGIAYSTGGEQLVGSALQRVSEEARAIVMQYSQDINGLATQQLGESQALLTQYTSLYGADATRAVDTSSKATPPEPTIQRFTTAPNVDLNEFNVVKAGDGSYLTLKISDFKTVWGGYKKAPSRKTLDGPNGPGPGNYVIVKRPNGGFEVRTK